MADEVEICITKDCGKPARCAIRTTRPSRPDIRVTIYTDNRHAPKSASRYCQGCAIPLASGLVQALVDGDD